MNEIIDTDWTCLEGIIEKIYDNMEQYKEGLTPKAKLKGFAFLLKEKKKNEKIIVIADKDLLKLDLVRIGNSVRLYGWFNEKGIFLATATMGHIEESTFEKIKHNLKEVHL